MELIKKIKIFDILFWLYLLMLPLMSVPRPFPLGAKVQYADIIFIFLFFLWSLRIFRFKNISFPSRKIIILLSLLIVANLFSCLNSKSFSSSIVDYLGLLYLVSLFIVFASCFQMKRMFFTGALIIFLTSLAASIIGIGSLILYKIGKYAWATNFLLFTPLKDSIVPFPRIRSTFLTPEMFILFSQLGMVCGMISLESQNNPKIKRLFSISIIVIIAAVLFSYSRSLTGFFMALSTIVLYKKNIRFAALVRILTILVSAVLLISAIIFSIWIVYPVTLTRDVNTELMTITLRTSPDIRALLRDAAFRIALKHPFFGIGQGMFTYEVNDYLDLNAARNTIKINDWALPLKIDPHCAYFGSIAETGFISLLLLLVLFCFIISESMASIKEHQNSKSINIKIFLFASFLGYLLSGWFVDIFTIRQFWINMALLVCCENTMETKND